MKIWLPFPTRRDGGSVLMPAIQESVGRDEELLHYHKQLESRNIAVLKGLSGSGKSHIAARLLADYDDWRKLWMVVRPGWNDSLEDTAWDVSNLLRKEGSPAAFRYLERQNRLPRPHPIRIRIDHILEELEREPTILCIDNYEVIDDNRAVRSLLEELRDQVARHSDGRVKLVVTSRVDPSFIYDFGNEPLKGFSHAETVEFLERQGIELADEEIEILYQETEGLPLLLRWFADWYMMQAEPRPASDFVAEMELDASWQEFLARTDYWGVGSSEHMLMGILSVFRKPIPYPVLRDEICIDRENITNIGDVLRRLLRRYVVMRDERCRQAVVVPRFLRRFYYERLNPDVRRRVHARAACHYERLHDDAERDFHKRQARDANR